MTISLGRRLPGGSSDLPGSHNGSGQSAARRIRLARNPTDTAPLFGLAPSGVCRARPVTRPAGELLPHRFTLTPLALEQASAAVCFLWHFPYPEIRAVGVTHHRALWSPDFPPWLDLAPMSHECQRPGGHPVHHETSSIIACISLFSTRIFHTTPHPPQSMRPPRASLRATKSARFSYANFPFSQDCTIMKQPHF